MSRKTSSNSSTALANAHDVAIILRFASDFLADLVRLEDTIYDRRTVEMGGLGHPSRDRQIAYEFTRSLFAFSCAMRACEDYLPGGVDPVYKTAVKRRLERSRYCEFHRKVANQGIHEKLWTLSRRFYAGGDKDGTWAATYLQESLGGDLNLTFQQLLLLSGSDNAGGVVEIGRIALIELILLFVEFNTVAKNLTKAAIVDLKSDRVPRSGV